MALKRKCARAACFASDDALKAAILAVIVVPIFSPKMNAHAVGKSMSPLTANVIVMATVALDDWTMMVTIVPIAITIRVDGISTAL